MLVRAKQPGLYDHKLRKEGEVFELKPLKGLDSERKKRSWTPEQLFSERWMERVDAAAKVKRAKVETEASQETEGDDVI